jgi:hypothetical protein
VEVGEIRERKKENTKEPGRGKNKKKGRKNE